MGISPAPASNGHTHRLLAEVHKEVPPFQDLVRADDAPPFEPLAYVEPEVRTRRTVLDRWKALSSSAQIGLFGLATLGVLLGALIIPGRKDIQFVLANDPPPPPERTTQLIPESVPVQTPIKTYEYVMAQAAIPQNERITRENLAKYFKVLSTTQPQTGAVTRVEAVMGQYAQVAINKDQMVMSTMFGLSPVVVETPIEKHEVRVITTQGVEVYYYERKQGDPKWVLVRKQVIAHKPQ